MIRFLAAMVDDRRLAVATAGALAIGGGAAAPWARVASPLKPLTELGLDADGKVTILCGAAALAAIVAFAMLRQRDLAVAAAAFGGIALGLQIVYEINLRHASARAIGRILAVSPGAVTAGFQVKTGIGLWIGIAGASATILSSLALAARGRAAAAPLDTAEPPTTEPPAPEPPPTAERVPPAAPAVTSRTAPAKKKRKPAPPKGR